MESEWMCSLFNFYLVYCLLQQSVVCLLDHHLDPTGTNIDGLASHLPHFRVFASA
jgi:hypothetical protein